MQKNKIATSDQYLNYNYIRKECSNQIIDRLKDIKYNFPIVCDIGCHGGEIKESIAGKKGVMTIYECDKADKMLELTRKNHIDNSILLNLFIIVKDYQVLIDEELLPFKDESFDLVTSCLSLHWTNNLDLALREIRRVLKPDGYFSGCVFGGESLKELKYSFINIENVSFYQNLKLEEELVQE